MNWLRAYAEPVFSCAKTKPGFEELHVLLNFFLIIVKTYTKDTIEVQENYIPEKFTKSA